MDDRCKLVWVDGKRRLLSPKEYTLFKLLMINAGRVVASEEIIASLWPTSDRADDGDVKQCVHRLRSKIEKDSMKPHWIQNVRGFGYRLAL